MNRHPGGEAQTLHLLEYVKFRKGMEALDLGAGEGETVRILKSLGINAHGVDLSPRSRDVQKGDFLNLDYTAESMDLCISQCAFFVSGDQQKAVSECWRVLKKGGLLVLSDLDQGNLVEVVKCTGFFTRKTRRLSGGNIIWKQSGMIHSAARSISFCRSSIKEKS